MYSVMNVVLGGVVALAGERIETRIKCTEKEGEFANQPLRQSFGGECVDVLVLNRVAEHETHSEPEVPKAKIVFEVKGGDKQEDVSLLFMSYKSQPKQEDK